jgi:hypothetical protein
MSEMTKLRKEDLSLYYFIKDVVLSDFIEQEELIPLNFIQESSTSDSFVYEALTEMLPNPNDRGRGWCYFDELNSRGDSCLGYFNLVSGTRYDGLEIYGVPEQTDRVTVYSSTTVSGQIVYTPINADDYMIDYIDGRIITDGTVIPTHVSYYWNYVSIVDEWAAVEASEPPVVVIDIQGTDKSGYQLGGGKKIVRKVDLHIFASNTAERNDIAETLYDALYLGGCPLMDFPLGSVLDYDGTWYGRRYMSNKLTSLFDRVTVSGTSNLMFENVTNRHINLPLIMSRNMNEIFLSDLNAYRSKISFDMFSYTDM